MMAEIFNRPKREYTRLVFESDAWTASDINKEYRRLYGILRKRYQRMISSPYASSRMRTKMASLMQFSPSSFEKTKIGVKNPKKINALSEIAFLLGKKTSSVSGMTKDIANKVKTLHKNHKITLDFIDESNFLDYAELIQGFRDSHEKDFKYDVLEEDMDLLEIIGNESSRFIGEHLDEFRKLLEAKNVLQLAIAEYNKVNSSLNKEALVFYNDELSEFYNAEFGGFTKKTIEAMAKVTAKDIANFFIEKHGWPKEILDYIK